MSQESTLKLSHNASVFSVYIETEQNVSDHNILIIYTMPYATKYVHNIWHINIT